MTWDEFGQYMVMAVGAIVIAQYLINNLLKSIAKFIRAIRCDDKDRDDEG